jgi:hypothetical protein
MRKYFLIPLILLLMLAGCSQENRSGNTLPRVFVFTDINIDSGDPDDRQSLIHLLWYADELDIRGIVPDRWNAHGYEACMLAIDAYAKDYEQFGFAGKGFPVPVEIEKRVAVDFADAVRRFADEASDESSPLYVLIWGSMENFGRALRMFPHLADNIRVITIGTGLMMEEYRQYIPADWEVKEKPCMQPNWNGAGREQIYTDARFDNMWWLEMNWTYEGMFSGEEPAQMFHKLAQYGALGYHMIEVVANEPWAQYFRVGDTPSVLYVIDPDNNLDDPTSGSWAGRFIKPFPDARPNYYADCHGDIEWDYADPCNTWHNHVRVRDHAKSTLEQVRSAMYDDLIGKLQRIYR